MTPFGLNAMPDGSGGCKTMKNLAKRHWLTAICRATVQIPQIAVVSGFICDGKHLCCSHTYQDMAEPMTLALWLAYMYRLYRHTELTVMI